MSGWLFWICGIGSLIVAAALIEAYVKRNRNRNLADMRPDPDKVSKVGGIERYGLDPLAMAQAEHQRLEKEGWTATRLENEPNGPNAGKEDKQDERR